MSEEVSQFQVRGADGVELAVWASGSGPSLVMVHGSIADHTAFDSFVEVLGHGLTTNAMDRRGFGASGDGAEYAMTATSPMPLRWSTSSHAARAGVRHHPRVHQPVSATC